MSGIAQMLKPVLNSQYLAGLWKNILPWLLLWEARWCTRYPAYRAPTWSWASLDGHIVFPLQSIFEEDVVITIMEAEVTPVADSTTGQICDAFIKLQGDMIEVTLRLARSRHTGKLSDRKVKGSLASRV